MIIKEFNEVFQQVDAIITPTTPTTAFKFGEKSQDPLRMYWSEVCTAPVNMADCLRSRFHAGFCGLPVGMQIIGITLWKQ